MRVLPNNDLTHQLSECSLKTSVSTRLLHHLSTFKHLVGRVFKQWGGKSLRRAHFLRHRRKHRFYDTIVNEMFPEENAIICMGDGNIQTTLKGTTTCPLGKIAQAIGKQRRLVYVRECYTTQKCSRCCHRDAMTTCVDAKHKGIQRSVNGRAYMPDIHGLPFAFAHRRSLQAEGQCPQRVARTTPPTGCKYVES